MFGGLLIPILGWLIWRWHHETSRSERRNGIMIAIWTLAGISLASYILGLLIMAAPQWIQSLQLQTNPATAKLSQKILENAGRFITLHGSGVAAQLIFGSLAERVAQPGTWITLLVLMGLTWGLLAKKNENGEENSAEESIIDDVQPEQNFTLLLVLVGLGLTLAPEFFYLLDQFGYRMNTIFKFYYQGWLLWSIAAGFALVVMWNQRGRLGHLIFKIVSILTILIGLIYPAFALNQRFNMPLEDWTLDGLTSTRLYNLDEYQAIEWLRSVEIGVIAEAVGGQYSDYGRIATHTGMPTVLGWPGHESQWGRTGAQLGSREIDIERLYESGTWEEAKAILDQYDIRYIYIGSLERSKYQVNELKFSGALRLAFQSGGVVIYEYDPLQD